MKYKKVVFVKPWKVEIQEDEIDVDKVPMGHVVLKTHYSLVSAGTELACLSGNESWFKIPATPGYVSVGEIVAKGKDITGAEIGDVVFQYGGHSEYVLTGADGIFIKVPEGIDEKLVPFARMASIAMTAIRVSEIELGDYVAVTGLGLVGNMAAQLANIQGANVIGIDLSPKRLELARKCGLKFFINACESNVKDKVMEITQSQGVTTLIEASGIPKVIADSLPLIGKFGEIIILGSPRGEYQHNLTEVLNYCHLMQHGCITFKGAHEWRYPVRHNSFVKHSIERNTKIIFQLMKQSRLIIEPLLSHLVKPDKVAAAYEGLRNNKDEYIGVVIDWN